jgi:hypothetical protein
MRSTTHTPYDSRAAPALVLQKGRSFRPSSSVGRGTMRITADPVEIGVTNLRLPELTARALPLPYERSENHAYSLVR